MEGTAARVDGLVAIVTGAASGLGLASARLLANEGATVFVPLGAPTWEYRGATPSRSARRAAGSA